MKSSFAFILFLVTLWIVNASASPFPCDCVGGYNPYTTPTFWYLLDYYGYPLEDGDCVCAYWVGPDGIIQGSDPAAAPSALPDDVLLGCSFVEYGGFYFSVTTYQAGAGHPGAGDLIYCVIYDAPCPEIGPSNYYGISDLHEVMNYLGEFFYCSFPGDPGYGHTDTRIPVELLFFEAIAGDSEVLLKWRTAAETNAQGFYVERDDVRSDMINAAGNSDVENDYSYLDRGLTNGVTYSYNLIGIDMEGIEYVLNAEPVAATPLPKTIPIELILFNAIGRDNEVLLHWKTATETGALGFHLTRDGYRITDEFIPAFGHSVTVKTYSYVDRDVQNDVMYSYDLIVLDTDGWEFVVNEQPISATPTSVINISLGPVQPNPFWSSTSIFFTTPEKTHVLIEIYDIAGLRVQTLVDAIKEAGQYSIQWDAGDVPNGVYFCRMRAGLFDETIELWLVREVDIPQSQSNYPTCFTLTQNYPNPFNAIAEIRYEIPQDVHVTLKIFNVIGQEIATLVDDDLTVGSYTTEWDGRDAHGQEVSAGIYLCVMRAGDFIQTRKMILLK